MTRLERDRVLEGRRGRLQATGEFQCIAAQERQRRAVHVRIVRDIQPAQCGGGVVEHHRLFGDAGQLHRVQAHARIERCQQLRAGRVFAGGNQSAGDDQHFMR
jgi:hypothetical protein